MSAENPVVHKHSRKLLVVITEAALERDLAREVMALGAHGYTTYDVRGAGRGGIREGAWEAERTIEMKVICDVEVADRIAARILERWGPNYSLTIFLADVTVFRPERY